ncbi:MAG: hypothetical protein GY697_09720 [Desulfobacterales bacterium]|nr:hypothetical protein [Desulfobacterales bacterium]
MHRRPAGQTPEPCCVPRYGPAAALRPAFAIRVTTPPGRAFILQSVHPQMVDFGSEQGLSDLETGGASEANAYRGE